MLPKTSRHRALALLAVVAVAVCSLCGARNSAATYFPLSANRRWEYRLQYFPADRTWPVIVHSRGPTVVPDLSRPAVVFDEQ